MAIYRVQLWPNGQCDGKSIKVEADSAKAAAETAHGRTLLTYGTQENIRAQVEHYSVFPNKPVPFYEPAVIPLRPAAR